MKLIRSTTSPYVRKVRVYLAETGISHRFVPVDAWQPTAELLAMAPIGKVPVLDLDDGTVLLSPRLSSNIWSRCCRRTTDWCPLRARRAGRRCDGVRSPMA